MESLFEEEMRQHIMEEKLSNDVEEWNAYTRIKRIMSVCEKINVTAQVRPWAYSTGETVNSLVSVVQQRMWDKWKPCWDITDTDPSEGNVYAWSTRLVSFTLQEFRRNILSGGVTCAPTALEHGVEQYPETEPTFMQTLVMDGRDLQSAETNREKIVTMLVAAAGGFAHPNILEHATHCVVLMEKTYAKKYSAKEWDSLTRMIVSIRPNIMLNNLFKKAYLSVFTHDNKTRQIDNLGEVHNYYARVRASHRH
ncbi:hypothetical protein ACFQY8_07625 [Alloscardovia venturai]|uniref:Uncharacterized protein n=1 Tax=Alloscardovia venturai TaxID=1769421 RepID=A0ABW2Y5Y0_9BIFI